MDVSEKNDSTESICKNGHVEIAENSKITTEESCGFEIGCGKCRTKRFALRCLNCCNNAKGMLAYLCIAVFVQGMAVNGLVNIVISTLEKRFHLRSSETGLLAGCYDIGFLIAVTITTYIGGRGHKPLWIGWGVLIMGLGSITFTLPHFIAPVYNISNMQSYACGANETSMECGESHLRVYRGLFFLGNLMHGIGASGMYTLGITYLDANVKEKASSIYHGIFFAFSVAGPGVGFLLGGAFIKMYTNIGEIVDVDEKDSLWIGNWWLGFMCTGVLAIIVSVPLLMYPRQLPGTEKYRKNREEEINPNDEAMKAKEDSNFGKGFKDIPRCFLLVLKNPTLVLLSISGAMDSGTVIALATFGPKYSEAMFRLSPSNAALYFGIISIVSACSAQLIGGILVSKLKLRVPSMLKLCIVCSTVALGCLFVFLIQCENPSVPGVNIAYHGESDFSCSSSCGCSTGLYDPICGADGLTYLSFCDANCSKTENGEFLNCTQVFKSNLVDSMSSANAKSGKCEVTGCPSVGIMLVFGAFGVFFTFLKFQPALQCSLRTVPLTQRSFAIGIQWVIMRTLGLIPLPIILGQVLDLSCLVWGEICGICGSCKLYDNASMAKYMTLLFTVAKGVSVICLILAFVTYKPPKSEGTSKLQLSNNTSSTSNGSVASNENGVQLKSATSFDRETYENKAFE